MELVQATINQNSKTSGIITTFLMDGHNYQAAGLIIPAALTSSTIKFNAAMTANGTLYRVKQSGLIDDYEITAGVGWVPLDKDVFASVPFLQLEVNTEEGAARTFWLALRTF